jgi:hypothetical protein
LCYSVISQLLRASSPRTSGPPRCLQHHDGPNPDQGGTVPMVKAATKLARPPQGWPRLDDMLAGMTVRTKALTAREEAALDPAA